MVTRKYLKDYRLEDSLDARGRHRTVAVYMGEDFFYASPEKADRRHKARMLLLTVSGWIAFVGALLPQSAATHKIWCAIPLIACVLPLALQSASVYILLTGKEPFRRSDADKLSRRLPATAVSVMILAGIALLGFIVTAVMAWSSLVWGDAVFASLSAVLTAVSAVAWRTSLGFRTEARKNIELLNVQTSNKQIKKEEVQ